MNVSPDHDLVAEGFSGFQIPPAFSVSAGRLCTG